MEQFNYDELSTLQYVLLVHMNTDITKKELSEIKKLSDKILLLKINS